MEIKWVKINSKPYLKFNFAGNLDEQEALKAIEEWKKEFNSRPNLKISLVWDCLKMKNYDSKARTHWQSATKELKSQIDTIWLISNSSLIRVGANIIASFVGLSINAVDSEHKIM